MRKKAFILPAIAAVLVLFMSIGSAWSYFTDTTTVEGSLAIAIAPETEIVEHNEPGMKEIQILNKSKVTKVWVRVRVYASSKLGASATGTDWTLEENGWYVYGKPLDPNTKESQESNANMTQPLTVTFDLHGAYEAPQDGNMQDVVVVYEYVPVAYDAQGNAQTANWNN